MVSMEQTPLNFDGPQKRWDFLADYTSGDRASLASRISTLLGQGIKISEMTEEEQAFYKWQKEVFSDDDSQPNWKN